MLGFLNFIIGRTVKEQVERRQREGKVGRYWVSEATRPIVSCPVAS